jgi:hypothetical protein
MDSLGELEMQVPLLRHSVRVLALGLVALSLAACTLGQTRQDQRVCTLIGCGPSLEIILAGDHIPTDFSMVLTSPSEDPVTVRCTEGTAQFEPPQASRWSPACPAGGVSFEDFTPERLSITVRWSDGETTQDFQPDYTQSQPNGPDCQPACRAVRLDLRIPAVPAYGDESTWETYIDEQHGFSIRYPAALTLEFGPQVDGYGVVFVGDQIQVHTSPANPLVCRGQCPIMESTEPVTIAGRDAHLVRGYVGSIGGNIPRRFMLYLIRSGTTYISLVLYAGSRDATTADPTTLVPLQEADIGLFDRMVETLEIPY